MDGRVGRIAQLLGLVVLLGIVGCGDPDTTDSRGYTKAPLEHPGVLIRGEGSSAMDSLGTPILPRDTVIPAENIQPTADSTKK